MSMSADSTVTVERLGRVLSITLNRPAKRNALNAEMCKAIASAVDAASQDAAIGSILICGNGRVFCAGMDVEEGVKVDRDVLAGLHEQLFTLDVRSLKPIVICVHGAALGGGLGLVAQGHAVIAAEGTGFGLPEIKIGLWPLLIYRSLEAALGPRRTLELSLTGRTFNADEALSWGLVSTVCHAEEVYERGRTLANEFAHASPKAIEAGMNYRRLSGGKSFDDASRIARDLRNKLMDTPDFQEGVAAFKEKREPSWPSLPRS